MDSTQHIKDVEQYIASLYQGVLNAPNYIESLFGESYSHLDKEILKDTFNSVSYAQVFRHSPEGMVSVFSDYNTAVLLQNAIGSRWVLKYYLEMLVKEGIAHKIDTNVPGKFVYAVKEGYRPVLNAILVESLTNSGS